LKDTDHDILMEERGIIGLAGFVFLITAAIIFVFVLRFVNQPIKRLIAGTRQIARGRLHDQSSCGKGGRTGTDGFGDQPDGR
jgi:nitrogen fixation/metabolism regulation signal transduction histidine kinase